MEHYKIIIIILYKMLYVLVLWQLFKFLILAVLRYINYLIKMM